MYGSTTRKALLAVCLVLLAPSTAAHVRHNSAAVRPFQVDLSAGLPHMHSLLRQSKLPGEEEYPGVGDTAGIDLGVLRSLRGQWLNDFDWLREEAEMNSFRHYTTEIEGLTVHFIHERSSDPDAIPIILNHGWPGSFLEFTPIIKNLTSTAVTSKGKPISFDVVVPSLPGFAFSSKPPVNWTVEDTARIQHTLMNDVLGYRQFAVHGTDWGCAPSYTLYANYSDATRAAHLTFLPFLLYSSAQLVTANITLDSALEQEEQRRTEQWSSTGNAYYLLQLTKPNTIGLALYDNPLGQLSWIGEKFITWSDPHSFFLTYNEILRSTTLYYLTRSFVSSIYIYFQNPNGFRSQYTKPATDAPLPFSAFRYNIAVWPEALVAKVGNLVSYRNHDSGGHFAGLDNPADLVADLREIREYWNGTA
ncbi:hypothetical protein B0A48_11024 [Cryoendolithus antarcticus]|uniref:Epoxide hydrolase N-terminal domain-containing protein n=1 Tax=Cryoendolithus antarcticus TaxID=1507870 RepID=A0A1V8SZ26_9PEZI|nr:hypothetical protein B0A48_11024 [Cryoendolithus antarcticus]